MSRHWRGRASASAFRPLADLRDAESRDKTFDVGFPLESGHRAPVYAAPNRRACHYDYLTAFGVSLSPASGRRSATCLEIATSHDQVSLKTTRRSTALVAIERRIAYLKIMATTETILEQLDDVLTVIDGRLAEEGIPLANRPFEVAVLLIQHKGVEVIPDHGTTRYEPDGSTDFLVTDWFRALYKDVESWYRDRYGTAYDQSSEKCIGGVVLIRGTPFALRIPTSRVRPAEPGKTIWASFPDHVEADDVVTDWLVKPPNLGRLESPVRAQLEKDIREIAGALRFVRTNLMAVTDDDDAFAGFRHGVVTHLQRAAELILAANGDDVQKAWWELQMTIESALKALLLQKTGAYPPKHKLNVLFDAAVPAGLDFDQCGFERWPMQKEMSDLRYAQGTRRDVAGVFEAYRLTLALAAAAVNAMDRMGIGQAQFKLQQPPWMRDEDADSDLSEGETP